MNSFIKNTIILLTMALVGGCGGNDAFTTPSGSTGGGSSGGGTTLTGQPSVTLSLTDGSGTATTSISVDSPGTLKATVVDELGSPVAGAVVTFTASLATFNPTAGSVLTNSSGVATVTMLAGTTTGADTVSADVTVSGTTASTSLGYSVSATSVTLSPLVIGTNPLSANGTTSLTVTVLDGSGSPYTTPVDVDFASSCSAIGKATISSPVTTTNGVATSNYLDKGCANTDTVTASLTLGGTTLSASANLVVNPASAGSIQFLSASPTNITLKGTGGAGNQETSTVTFKVVDNAGNPKSSATVDFTLSTAVGGIALVPSSATTDSNGEVSTVVSSGSVASAVRVIATVSGTSLQTQSDQLTITTGVPAQDHFSLAATTHAVEGWGFDGVTSILSVILSDHFSNPVPDGTAVNFIAEGAQVGGSCITVDGGCSVTFTSAELRPSNGRVSVLAYGVGEEGFTDTDGDGYVSSNAERVDANGASTDMGETWVDYDESGTRDATEPFIDFDSNGSFDAADGLYNGVLCLSGGAWCNTSNKNINVRRQEVIVLSGSGAFTKISTDPTVLVNPDVFNSFGGTVVLDNCTDGVAFNNNPVTVYLQITDLHGNTMPAGSTVQVATTNGNVEVTPATPITDSIGCVHGDSQFTACPAGAPALATSFFIMTSDATQNASTLACTNSKTNGLLTISVTTPKGTTTDTIYSVTD